MQRPDLVQLMHEYEHVANGVLEIAADDACVWILQQVFEGELLPMPMAERPEPIAGGFVYHYHKTEVAQAVREFSNAYKGRRRRLH